MIKCKTNKQDGTNFNSPLGVRGSNKTNSKAPFRGLGVIFLFIFFSQLSAAKLPWENGKLKVSENHHYLQFENGTPFFWLGDTGWLLPERLDRDEADFYLTECSKRGYNVVQVQTINDVPSLNIYGQSSMPDGFDFSNINKKGVYGYWDHMDYIIKTAEKNGIYIGMVCIWGGLVKAGKMNVQEAQAYGKFLGERYKNSPNIIWFIGGDIRGDVKPEVWAALATSIKAVDKNHLMTFHPRGRTSSATWFDTAEWLDFNMFQSGHRRYGQRMGDGDYTIKDNTEEDNWRYVEQSQAMTPLKPVLDGEPSYEDIPQGLHDFNEVRWNANDVRRYAYWSVFAGSFGHTYGNNSIMQFYKPGVAGAYGANRPWYDCIEDPGYNQMKYLKELMLAFPFFERVPDQSIIAGQNGERYDRAIATRGNDYLMVYNYSGRPMTIDLSKISGAKKNCWWFNPKNGELQFIAEFDGKKTVEFTEDVAYNSGNDRVLIALDSSKDYIKNLQIK
ncbi:MAG: glycoside hydrolase family 140 protein [Paludibacter sp.]